MRGRTWDFILLQLPEFTVILKKGLKEKGRKKPGVLGKMADFNSKVVQDKHGKFCKNDGDMPKGPEANVKGFPLEKSGIPGTSKSIITVMDYNPLHKIENQVPTVIETE